MKYKISSFIIVLALLTGVFFSCEKDNDTLIIPEVEKAQFLPGNQRAMLVFESQLTESTKEIVIFWNNLQEQKELQVNQNPADTLYRVMMENMPEGDIEFNIYVRDEFDNKSQLRSVRGHIYGEKYQQSLKNRLFMESEITSGKAIIKWGACPEGAHVFLIDYLDNNDNLQTAGFEPSLNITTLENVKSGSTIKYRIQYLPEKNAIDTFYSSWEEVQIGLVPLEEFQLDKSLIMEHHLTNDRNGQHYNGSIAKLFDDVIHVDNYYSSAGGEQPLTFTFDLGQSVILSKFTITGRIAIPDRIPREFDIWATNDITNADTETPTADFEAWESESISKGWKKVGEFNDDYGAPEPDPDWNNPPIRDFLIKEDRDSQYRYIRFRIKSTWQEGRDISSQEVNIGEIDVFGKQ
uniref:DUF4998 domain-containing protein n=1 Tax=uncultured Draconibacterium sp. TaxID=1573823 RepID=UPI003216319A